MSMSQPASRSAARSAMVALEPGRMTRVGVARERLAGPDAHDSSTPGSASSGSRSSKLAICGRTRHGDLDAGRPLVGRAASSASASSAGRRPRLGEERDEAEAAASRSPRRSAPCRQRTALGSPRNLLTMKPAISAASSASITALVPTRLRDHAAPVDVADQHHRHVGGAGEAHIGDVVGAQIDLRRRCPRLRRARGRPRRSAARSCRARAASARGFISLILARPWRAP